MKTTYLLFLVLSVDILTDGKKLPSYVKKCKRQDPQLSECIREAFLAIQPQISKGVKAFKIPPLDPYVLPSAKLWASWMNCTLTDLKVYNMENVKPTAFKIDLENNPAISLDLLYSGLLESHYVIDGHILQFPLHGEGELELRTNSIEMSMDIGGKVIEKNGKEYLKLEETTFKIKSFDVAHVYLHNLFKDNPELTDRINKILLEDSQTYAQELLPLLEKMLGSPYEMSFKGTFDNFSLNELFD